VVFLSTSKKVPVFFSPEDGAGLQFMLGAILGTLMSSGSDMGLLVYRVVGTPREGGIVSDRSFLCNGSITFGSAWVESINIKKTSPVWQIGLWLS
jgi:hypothetical protein